MYKGYLAPQAKLRSAKFKSKTMGNAKLFVDMSTSDPKINNDLILQMF